MRYHRSIKGRRISFQLGGTYESQLHSAIETFATNEYAAVIDVGAAAGYYLVGLGLRLVDAELHAFDLDESALQATQTLAVLNGLEDRMHLHSEFDPSYMDRWTEKQTLLVCDVDGGERQIFGSATTSQFRNTDLIVELHEHFAPGVTQQLLDLLSPTHSVKLLEAATPNRKDYPALSKLTDEEFLFLVDERRANPKQTWAIATCVRP